MRIHELPKYLLQSKCSPVDSNLLFTALGTITRTWNAALLLVLEEVVHITLLLLILLMFISFWEKERDRVWVGKGQRERGRHRIRTRLQALSQQHRARRGAQTREPRDHDLSWSQTLNRLEPPRCPRTSWFLTKVQKQTDQEGKWPLFNKWF